MFVLAAFMLALFGATELRGQDQRPIALTHAVIIDGNGGAPIESGTIVVRGEKIEAIGPTANVPIPEDSDVKDLAGKVVMPGLADMHVHLTGGWDGISPDMLGYHRYLNALLYSGVTTVLDTGNVQPYIIQIRDEIAAGRLMGPTIYCAGALVDGGDPVWPPISYSVTSQDQLPRIVRQLSRDRVDIIKAYVGLSDRMMAALVQEGRKASLPVFVDQGMRNGSADLVRVGISAFAHLPTTEITDETMDLMKQRGIMFITTLTVTEAFSRRRLADLTFLDNPLVKDTTPPSFLADIRSEAQRNLTEAERAGAQQSLDRLKQSFINARKVFAAGLIVAAGTDAPYPGVFQGEGIHHELELLVQAGITPLGSISVATRNAAQLMGRSKEWGTLEPGKRADLIVVAGRPDRNIQDTRNIVMVMRLGRILDREKLKLDPNTDPGYRPVSPVSAAK